jgi:hypothetical protein
LKFFCDAIRTAGGIVTLLGGEREKPASLSSRSDSDGGARREMNFGFHNGLNACAMLIVARQE